MLNQIFSFTIIAVFLESLWVVAVARFFWWAEATIAHGGAR